MKIVSRWRLIPTWARVAAVAAGVAIVFGAASIPVAAFAGAEHNRQLSLEIAAKEAAAELKASAEAAEALDEAKDAAARLNAGFDGFTTSLGAAVHPDTAAAFEAARVKLAFAVDSRAEVDRLHTTAIGAGWTAVREPKLYPRFNDRYYASFVEDDNGIRLEFMYNPPRESSAD